MERRNASRAAERIGFSNTTIALNCFLSRWHARTAIERFASNCFSFYYLTKDALTSPLA
jgi:hypothetical protein